MIAIVGELNRNGGGSYHQSKKVLKVLSNIKDLNFKLLTINSRENPKKNNHDIFYNVNFIDKLFFYFIHQNSLR